MSVMITTALVVAVFALMANVQYKQSTNISIRNNSTNPSLSSYYLFVIFAALTLILVAGFRYGVGSDYGSYYWGYPRWESECLSRLQVWDEPGLSVLAKMVYWISEDGAFFIFLTSAITISLFVFTYAKHTDDFFFVIMLFIFTSCWNGSFNGVRQYLAAAIVFAGHRLIFDRKFIRYCILIFIASSFHVTALIMLPMYFIITKNLDFKKIIFILVFGIALVFSYDFLFDVIGVMKDNETGGSDTSYAQNEIHPLRIAIAFAPILVYFFLALQNKLFSDEENFYICFMFVNAAVILGTANSAYLNRAGIYFRPFIPLSLCCLTNKFDKKQQMLIKTIILVLYAIVWIYIDASGVEWRWMFDRPVYYNRYA